MQMHVFSKWVVNTIFPGKNSSDPEIAFNICSIFFIKAYAAEFVNRYVLGWGYK